MNRPTRSLALARHATAQPFAPSDAERELTSRGRDEAAAAGRWLGAERGFRPDAALVSGALRTRTTWDLMSGAAGWDLESRVEDALRTAEEDLALDLIRETSDQHHSLVVVGHNPTISHLASLLGDGDGEPGAEQDMIGGFPPGAVALFELDTPWAELGFGNARLVAFRPGATG